MAVLYELEIANLVGLRYSHRTYVLKILAAYLIDYGDNFNDLTGQDRDEANICALCVICLMRGGSS